MVWTLSTALPVLSSKPARWVDECLLSNLRGEGGPEPGRF